MKSALLTLSSILLVVSLIGCTRPEDPDSPFQTYGMFYASKGGETETYLRLPDSTGAYVDYLHWGYGGDSVPENGWVRSEPLSRYGVPEDAVAVRVHIKAKAKAITWATGDILADLQVKVRPSGDIRDPDTINEVIHAHVVKNEGETNENDGVLAVEDLNHVSVDVPIGSDGAIDVFYYPTILGDYADIELVVYLAGYWR